MAKKMNPPDSLKPIQHVIISVVFLLIGIALLLTFINYTRQVAEHGLSNKFYYVILIPMALSSSAFLFGVLKASAAYSGDVYNGKLQLGGPIVLFVLVMGGGFVLVPPDSRTDFPYVITLRDPSGRPLKDENSTLTLNLDNNTPPPLKVEVGKVYFRAIPIAYKEKQVDVTLESPNWVFLTNQVTARIKLDSAEKVLTVKLKEGCTTVIVRTSPGTIKKIGLHGSTNFIQPDSAGLFTINIPEHLQNETGYTLIVIPQNGSQYEQAVFPCQNNDIAL